MNSLISICVVCIRVFLFFTDSLHNFSKDQSRFTSSAVVLYIFLYSISESFGGHVVLKKLGNDTSGEGKCFSQNEIHSREKRQLPLMFPEGGTSKLLLGFAMPIENPIKFNLIFAINFQYQYAVPPNISFFTQYYPFVSTGRRKRSQGFEERSILYTALEKTMDGIGIDGHECLLRTVCEAAEAPVSRHGLIGQLLQLILTPPDDLDSGGLMTDSFGDEYRSARKAGDQLFDCRKLYPGCPAGQGFFDIISYLI